MAWENQIMGWTILEAYKETTIPKDAVYLSTFYGSRWNVYHFKVPIYKKVRTKKK